MYLLKVLGDTQEGHPGRVNVEYRLACSGEFYNRKILTCDWRKSDVTRILLERPFQIYVASRPFDSYPQELCVRVSLDSVTEKGGTPSMRTTRTFLPDTEVIEDLCAVLSLLSRRLVSMVTKTREKHHDAIATQWHDAELPMPILDRPRVVAWARRPATVITSATGQEFKSNDPPPVGADPHALAKFLIDLPRMQGAQDIIYAARLYKSALELIESSLDISYLMLVSVVESLASVALSNFEPDEAEKLSTQTPLKNLARSLGIDEAQAGMLALEACKGNRWLKRRFVKFCTDFCRVTELGNPDGVFLTLDHLNPPSNEFEKEVRRIYDARSKNLHVGSPFPPGAAIGLSPRISVHDLPLNPLGRPDIPPVPWFERVVSIAAQKFLTPVGNAPFVEYCPEHLNVPARH